MELGKGNRCGCGHISLYMCMKFSRVKKHVKFQGTRHLPVLTVTGFDPLAAMLLDFCYFMIWLNHMEYLETAVRRSMRDCPDGGGEPRIPVRNQVPLCLRATTLPSTQGPITTLPFSQLVLVVTVTFRVCSHSSPSACVTESIIGVVARSVPLSSQPLRRPSVLGMRTFSAKSLSGIQTGSPELGHCKGFSSSSSETSFSLDSSSYRMCT